MDLAIKEKFIQKWNKYYPGSDLPIACDYSDELNGADFPKEPIPEDMDHMVDFLINVEKFKKDKKACYGHGCSQST